MNVNLCNYYDDCPYCKDFIIMNNQVYKKCSSSNSDLNCGYKVQKEIKVI